MDSFYEFRKFNAESRDINCNAKEEGKDNDLIKLKDFRVSVLEIELN